MSRPLGFPLSDSGVTSCVVITSLTPRTIGLSLLLGAERADGIAVYLGAPRRVGNVNYHDQW